MRNAAADTMPPIPSTDINMLATTLRKRRKRKRHGFDHPCLLRIWRRPAQNVCIIPTYAPVCDSPVIGLVPDVASRGVASSEKFEFPPLRTYATVP